MLSSNSYKIHGKNVNTVNKTQSAPIVLYLLILKVENLRPPTHGVCKEEIEATVVVDKRYNVYPFPHKQRMRLSNICLTSYEPPTLGI